MKAVFTSTVIVLITTLISCTPRKDISESLPGSLVLVSGAGSDTLYFERTDYEQNMKGFRMEIQPDGEFIDALCKRVFYNHGKWILNPQDSLLETTVPVNLSYFNSRILKVDDTELVLVGLRPD